MSRFKWIAIAFIGFLLITFIPIKGLNFSQQAVLGTTFAMAILWLSDAIPMGATSLLPLALFPLLGVMSASEVAKPYAHHLIFLFLGGLVIAQAIQKWGLHKRIAVNIVDFLGADPNTIILGFMVATAFLSMWMSNTATTLMMMPIGLALIQSFSDRMKDSDEFMNFSKTLMLSIAFAASIGGVATLVGTPPNLVFAGMYNKLFGAQISFARWMEIGLPISLFLLIFAWVYMVYFCFPFKGLPKENLKEIIDTEKEALSDMSFEEKVVMVIFALTAIGWITRAGFDFGSFKIRGWASFFPYGKYIKDSTVAMFFATLMFFLPSKEEGKAIIDFSDVVKIPWEVLFLFGGGFALAESFKATELTHWVGHKFAFITHLHPLLLVFLVILVLGTLTQFTSNTATTTIMLPILAGIAQTAQIDPLILLIPATLGASFAFVLPVATPPNAIVMGSGVISVKDMAKAGIWLQVFATIFVTFYCYFFLM